MIYEKDRRKVNNDFKKGRNNEQKKKIIGIAIIIAIIMTCHLICVDLSLCHFTSSFSVHHQKFRW